MFEMAKTLIVVYKDEMLMNQFKKLVETKHSCLDEQTVERHCTLINIVSWTEKVWLANKKAGNIKDKVLFLGDIKNTDKLTPVVDVQFNQFGVKYGWAGNQAVLFVDPSAIRNKKDYLEFMDALSLLSVPDMIKKLQNVRIEETGIALAEETAKAGENPASKKTPALFVNVKEHFQHNVTAVKKNAAVFVDKTSDLLRNKNAVMRQMLFYGVENFCNKGLEDFMNL